MKSHILCAGQCDETFARFITILACATDGLLEVSAHPNLEELLESAATLHDSGTDIPLVFLDPAGSAESLEKLRDCPSLATSRLVLLSSQTDEISGYDGVLNPADDEDRIHSFFREQLTRRVIAHSPELLEKFQSLMDFKILSSALISSRENFLRLHGPFESLEDSMLGASKLPDDELENAMIRDIDRLLHQPPRTQFETGETIVLEGDTPTGIWVILEGRVELFRTVEGEDLIFHSETTGRIVGLMALYRHSPIFFSCRAKTAVVALHLSHAEIRTALHASPEFATHLIGVIIRSMARRNRRAAHLLVTIRTLNHQLAEQRDELELALNTLRAAQEMLIESEKMSTLGTLAAGMAHELNNPIAAILRATEYLGSDIKALLAEAPELSLASAALPMAMERIPLSTSEEREIKSKLTDFLRGDRGLAAGLFSAGIRDVAELDELLTKHPHPDRKLAISRIERGGQIGAALKNLDTCSRRISNLVRSLKIYARDDQEMQSDVDLHQTLEDVVILLANQLRDIELHKEYGTIPLCTCLPSQLEQVWTNLLINAIQAMDGKGIINIRTAMQDDGMIGITIEDHGPGIPLEAQSRLFENRFTTRTGRVEFGLGLGLPISKTLIANHGGRISFQSRPGLTRFLVELPAQPNIVP